jgi:hypothetical protein
MFIKVADTFTFDEAGFIAVCKRAIIELQDAQINLFRRVDELCTFSPKEKQYVKNEIDLCENELEELRQIEIQLHSIIMCAKFSEHLRCTSAIDDAYVLDTSCSRLRGTIVRSAIMSVM